MTTSKPDHIVFLIALALSIGNLIFIGTRVEVVHPFSPVIAILLSMSLLASLILDLMEEK